MFGYQFMVIELCDWWILGSQQENYVKIFYNTKIDAK